MSPCNGAGSSSGLASWLCACVFVLPPLPPIQVAEFLGFTTSVQIDGLRCGQVHVGQLTSLARAVGDAPNLTLSVTDLSLNCSASEVAVNIERAGHQPFLHPSAEVAIAVENASATVVIGLPVSARTHGMPVGVNVTIADLYFEDVVPKIQIPGLPKFLHGLDTLIDKAVHSLILSEVGKLPALIDGLAPGLLDPLLANASEWLLDHYPPVVAPEPPPPTHHWVDNTTNTTVATTTTLVDWNATGNPLHVVSFLVDAVVGPDGPAGVNGALRLLTNGTGTLTLTNATLSGLLPSLTLPTISLRVGNLSLANVTLSLRGLSARALDTVDTLELRPSGGAASHHSLDLAMGWERLAARITLGVEATPLPGGLVSGETEPLDETFELDVNLAGLRAGLTLYLGLNETYINETLQDPMPALHSPRCLALRALMAADSDDSADALDGGTQWMPSLNASVRLRAFNLTIKGLAASLTDLSGRALERELDAAVDSTLRLLLDGFPTALTQLINAAAGAPLRDLLNSAVLALLEAALAGPPCPQYAPPPAIAHPPPPPPPPPTAPAPGMVNWRTSAARTITEYVLADVLGAPGVDSLIDRLLNASGHGSRGALVFNLSSSLPPLPIDLPLGLGNWSVGLGMLTVSGLDTITKFAPFGVPPNTSAAALDPAALTTAIEAGMLGVALDVTLARAAPVAGAWPERSASLTLSASLSNSSVFFGGRLAFNLTRLLVTPLDTFTHLAMLPCLTRPFLDAALYDLDVAADMFEIAVAGNDWGSQPPPGSVAVLNPPFGRIAIPGPAAATVASALTYGVRLLLDVVHGLPCTPPPPSPPAYFNLSSSSLLQELTHVLENTTNLEIGGAIDRFTSLLNRLFNNYSVHWDTGSLHLPPLSLALHDEKVGDIRAELANLTIENADSLYAFDVRTYPDAPVRLTTGIAIGNSTERPLVLSTSMHLQLDGTWHALEVRAAVSGLVMELGLDVLVDTAILPSLTISNLLHPADMCLLRPVEALLIDADATSVTLDSAVEGSGIDLHLWARGADLGANASAGGPGGLFPAHKHITHLSPQLPVLLRSVINLLNDNTLGPLMDSPHTTCDRARGVIPPAPPPPMPHPAPSPSELGKFAPMLWGVLSLGILILLFGCIYGLHHVLTRPTGSQSTADAVNLAMARTEALLAPASNGMLTASSSASTEVPRTGAGVDTATIGGAPSTRDARHAPKERSLAHHTSPCCRFFFTLALLGNAAFFLYANTHNGATVHVKLWLGGQRVQMPGVFDFGLLSSVEDMWQSGAYPLSVIVAFMSGMWTYIKLLLIGYLFWASPERLPTTQRGVVLRLLDGLGKWCLVDTQMLMIIMVALHFDLTLPSDEPGAPPLVDAQVETTPMIGVDTFLLATLSSLILAHIALHVHRVAARRTERERTRRYARELAGAALGMLDNHSPAAAPASAELPSCNGASDSSSLKPSLSPLPVGGEVRLHATRFMSLGPRTRLPGFGARVSSTPSARPGTPLALADHAELLGERLPLGVRLLVPLGLIVCVPMIVAGLAMPCFTLHVQGIVGYALGPEPANTTYSLLSLCAVFGGVSTLAPVYVMAFLQLVLFATMFIAPLMWPFLVLALWAVPMRPRAMRTLLIVTETTYAWAMLDVICVIVAVSLLELDMVAKFTLGNECDAINAFLRNQTAVGDLMPGEPSCFGVHPTLESGFFMLTFAVVIATITGTHVTLSAHVALAEHAARARVQ